MTKEELQSEVHAAYCGRPSPGGNLECILLAFHWQEGHVWGTLAPPRSRKEEGE